jgi:hypothetical protein
MIPDDPFVLLRQVSYVELEASLGPCCGDFSEVKSRLRMFEASQMEHGEVETP